jgi:fumarate reductase subunit D
MLLLLPVALLPGVRSAGSGIVLGLFLFVGILACLVYAVIAYLRNSLALPAAVIENLRVRAAMRRSKNLATGRIGRIFVLLLLVYALWMVATVIQLPFVFLAARAGAAQQYLMQGLILGINFVVTTVVGPIAAIGLCLFYFDERVRREGFDIEMLLHGASISSPPTAPLPEPATLAGTPDQPNPLPEQA